MKRIIGIFICLILTSGLFSGCGEQKEPEKEAAKPASTISTNTPSSNIPTTSNKAKVFKANELLSAEEAAAIVGSSVTLQEESLKIDNGTGTSKTYYEYELTPSTTLDALFRLVQNGVIPKDKLESGNTAASAFDSEKSFCADKAEALNGLGDKAFVHKNLGQVNVLYKDYYVLVAFGEDNYNSKELNIKIAKKILENIDKKK